MKYLVYSVSINDYNLELKTARFLHVYENLVHTVYIDDYNLDLIESRQVSACIYRILRTIYTRDCNVDLKTPRFLHVYCIHV